MELFGRLTDWDATVVAGRRNMHDQSPVPNEGVLVTVPVTPYSGNNASRVVNWGSYSAAAVLRGLTKGGHDVIYGSSPHLGAALAGLIIARVKRAGFVLEVRDLWPQILLDAGTMAEDSKIYEGLKKLERFLYQQADAVIVLARGSADPIVAEGTDAAKIHFLPNGADPADFEVDANRNELRDRFGFEGTVAIYAGAHGPANGLDFALKAADELSDTDFQMVFVGDGVTKKELIKQAKDLKLTNVLFLDPVSKEKIPELFAAADIGLHCLADIPLFHHGVSPNKLYDYMASGLAVVTNTPGEVASMVNEAGSGEAVGPTELASGIRRIIAMNADERARLGEAGRTWMKANRSRSAMASQLEALLDQVVAHR